MDEIREIDIDLRKIFYMMRTKLVFIFLATVLVAGMSGLVTHFFIAPTYTANAKFYVYSNPETNVVSDRALTQGEISASEDIINTYVYLLKTDTVIDKVAQDLNISNTKKLSDCIRASRVEDTLIFQVKVTTKNPKTSAQIANSIAKIAPDEIVKIVNAGGASVVDYAKIPTEPSSPNFKKNVFIGAAAGFIISFAFFFIMELFDNTITNSRDIEREFDIPVLGTIPRLDAPGKGGYSYKKDGDDTDSDALGEPSPPLSRPSNALLENIQTMKGETKND